jgi:hypothetical protein
LACAVDQRERVSAMTAPLSTVRGPLFSPRTGKYVAALMRQGDDFDYSKWLRQVREEEASPKSSSITCKPSELVATEAGGTMSALSCPSALSNSIQVSTIRAKPIPRGAWRSTGRSGENTAMSGPTRRLDKVRDSWHDFQANRARDGVYVYLGAVFETVMHYKERRRTNKLLRYAFKFAGLPFERDSNPFTAVIRCTCDHGSDSKTISKWARALRYVAHCKAPQMRLRTFMKQAGGVNACADLYARYFGRGTR